MLKSKNIIKFYLVKLLNPFIGILRISLYYGLPSRIARPSTIDILENLALESSAKYIQENGQRAVIFKDRADLWRFAINNTNQNGLFAEFGVSWGKSLNYLASCLPKDKIIFGFDSFQGLKEDFWGTSFIKGAFTTNGKIPKFPSNVELVVGWFSETLPIFLQNHNDKFSFIHLDADTYDSTKEVLELLANRVRSGTIIIFDEYIGFPNWQNNEVRAWKEFIERYNIKYSYIAFSSMSVVVKII